jgi:hypothetical protein
VRLFQPFSRSAVQPFSRSAVQPFSRSAVQRERRSEPHWTVTIDNHRKGLSSSVAIGPPLLFAVI